MFSKILLLNPIIQALIAGLFTYFITALGAALVLFMKKINKTFLDGMLGFSAGIMIAASFFSLLEPSIKISEELNINLLFIIISFIFGGLFLLLGDKMYDHFDKKKKKKQNIKRCVMLITSITLHNIPEGMAIGVAFGSVIYGIPGASLAAAWIIALGIGIQNFPEGSAISLPLRREGFSRKKAFFYGQISGIVEPIAAVLGAILVMKIRILLPILLSFAAGAMIYVVIEELIPESQNNKKKNLMTIFTLIGFSIMMFLDISLG
ncbi:MAG: ZIP family metal transporter [Bacilli bacterium]|nr:ZIP family metal transporter [Bacilli bacterium]